MHQSLLTLLFIGGWRFVAQDSLTEKDSAVKTADLPCNSDGFSGINQYFNFTISRGAGSDF